MAHQFNMTSQYIISLIFGVLQCSRTVKRKLTLEEYCTLICTFLTPDLDTKINFVFRVYDLDQDKRLSRHEVYSMLKLTIPQNDEEHDDMLKDLIELVMKVVDSDGNGSIDLEEFRDLVKKKNLLYMDLLGQCLPTDRDIMIFKNKLINKSLLEVKKCFLSENVGVTFGCLKPHNLSSDYYPILLDF